MGKVHVQKAWGAEFGSNPREKLAVVAGVSNPSTPTVRWGGGSDKSLEVTRSASLVYTVANNKTLHLKQGGGRRLTPEVIL